MSSRATNRRLVSSTKQASQSSWYRTDVNRASG
jgi:hypothetical protein